MHFMPRSDLSEAKLIPIYMSVSFNELKNFMDPKTPRKRGEKKMQMAHIYQPVMIKTLLQSNDKASVDKIAREINQHDQSNIDLFRATVKKMPGRVLTRRGIVKFENGKYILKINSLTKDQRKHLVNLCDNAVKDYEDKIGLKAIWDYKANPSRVISGTLRYDVIARDKGACVACHSMDKKLHVDHRIPVSWGGPTEIGNLVTLCYECNTQKRNRDDTDFRIWKDKFKERDKKCTFCNLESKAEKENSMAFAIKDKFPVTKSHMLVIPRRHTNSFFDLIPGERDECYVLLDELKQKIMKNDKTITGFNIGINDSEDAGQTIPHCHIHLIPRRKGDTKDPRGGIRCVIPGKRIYS